MSKAEALRAWVIARIGNPYIMGCTGAICTPAQRRARAAQYPGSASNIKKYCPVLSGKQATCTGCKYNGKQAYDCAQLTRRAAESVGLALPSGATNQWKSNNWTRKGLIKEMPLNAVCMVYRLKSGTSSTMAHTGIYMADGTYIHASSHAAGVNREYMPGSWTHYALLAGLNDESGEVFEMVYGKGSEGAVVKQIQTALILARHPLPAYGADGKFGAETEAAVKQYQILNALDPTGTVDDALFQMLTQNNNPPDTIPRAGIQAIYDALGKLLNT